MVAKIINDKKYDTETADLLIGGNNGGHMSRVI
jgi:hypothetical protein